MSVSPREYGIRLNYRADASQMCLLGLLSCPRVVGDGPEIPSIRINLILSCVHVQRSVRLQRRRSSGKVPANRYSDTGTVASGRGTGYSTGVRLHIPCTSVRHRSALSTVPEGENPSSSFHSTSAEALSVSLWCLSRLSLADPCVFLRSELNASCDLI
jgi:hypothetical protein